MSLVGRQRNEAEAGMLGQPVMPTPETWNVRQAEQLREGVTATDAPHHPNAGPKNGRQVRGVLRSGRGVAALPDRATVSNMAPDAARQWGISRLTPSR